MPVHPKQIERKNARARYVFVHRDPTPPRRVGILRFDANGHSSPMRPMQAIAVAASLGGKFRFGYRLNDGRIFGEYTEAEAAEVKRLCDGFAAEHAPALPLREQIRAKLVEMHELVQKLHEGLELASIDEQLEEWDLLPEDERKPALEGLDGTIAELRAALLERETQPPPEPEASEEAGEFTTELPPAPSKDDPIRMRHEELMRMSKPALAQWAQDNFAVALDQAPVKREMIKALAIAADGRLVVISDDDIGELAAQDDAGLPSAEVEKDFTLERLDELIDESEQKKSE